VGAAALGRFLQMAFRNAAEVWSDLFERPASLLVHLDSVRMTSALAWYDRAHAAGAC